MNTVRCPLQTGDEGAVLLSYLDRQLDAETMERLDRHVAQCESCTQLVEAHRAVCSALDEYRPIAVSADFDERVMARIAAEEPWWRRIVPAGSGWWKAAMPLTAACAVLVAVSVWRGPNEVPMLDSSEAQQVEDTLSDAEMLRQLGLTAEAPPSGIVPAAGQQSL